MKVVNFFFLCFCFIFFLPASADDKQPILQDKNIKEIALTETKDIKNPLKKAEALAVFVAKYHERDGYIQKEKEEAANKNKKFVKPYESNLFETKIGDSFAFATLYQQLCSAVGLNTVIIEGYAGRHIESFGVKRQRQKAIKEAFHMITDKEDNSLEKYRSAWNAVKIGEKWILVDTFWMIKGEKYPYRTVQSLKRMKRILENNKKKSRSKKNTSLNMTFFNPRPKEMIKTHFPFNETYQFLNHPYSLNRFLSQ